MCGALLWICVIAAPILLASGNLSDVLSRVTESDIHKILEDLRRRMCYDDPRGVPQLEPLTLNDEYPLDFSNSLGSLNGYTRNLHITGLSNFVLGDKSFHAADNSFDINISIPKLTISGEYASKGTLAYFFTVDGEDTFELILEGLHLRMTGSLVHNNNHWSLKITDLEPQLDALVSNFRKLVEDDEGNDFMNEAISELAPKYLGDYLSGEVIEHIKESIENVASDFIKTETALDLIDMLTGETSLFPPLQEDRACKIT